MGQRLNQPPPPPLVEFVNSTLYLYPDSGCLLLTMYWIDSETKKWEDFTFKLSIAN